MSLAAHSVGRATASRVEDALRPIQLVVLQGSSYCNLNCSYCVLSEASRRHVAVMSSDVIERLFDELFAGARLGQAVEVIWHSGEPLTKSPAYYEDAMALILGLRGKHGATTEVSFAIQTNATLINDRWCDFFLRHRDILSLGVSCDGPESMHDGFRVNWGGHHTHAKTIRGMDLLERYGIPYRIIAVVTGRTLRDPDAFFQFFYERRQHLAGFHFNILADGESSIPDLSYTPKDRDSYYTFYRALLSQVHERFAEDGVYFDILNFSQCMHRIVSADCTDPGAATHFEESSAPLQSLTVDAAGNVTTFYAGLSVEELPDQYGDGRGLSIGNILDTTLEDMLRSEKLGRIVSDFASSRSACASSCEYFPVCPGGYELTKLKHLGTYDATETAECLITVKALTDALLDDVELHVGAPKLEPHGIDNE